MSTQPRVTDSSIRHAPRVDERDKVRGATRFATDRVLPDMAYAVLHEASISRGHVRHIDTALAERVPGVRLVLTHENFGRVRSGGFSSVGGYGNQSLQPLTTDRIHYRGQPVACVVADTFEAATEAAALVQVKYDIDPRKPIFTIGTPGAPVFDEAKPPTKQPAPKAGNAEHAIAHAATSVDQVYETAPNHNNPIELISTVAEWHGGDLTIHEGNQNAGAVKHGLAQQLGISPNRIRVLTPFIGGSFGQKGFLMLQTVIAAVAARRLKRPVKLVLTRQQIFNTISFRPATRQRVRLGADRSGRMIGAIHETNSQTSRFDPFATRYTATTSRLYGIPNFTGIEHLIRTDTQTPGYMRAPFDHTSIFAFESAVDELAIAAGYDPVQLRLRSDASHDAITGKPLSSRHMNECLTRGARLFGWERRSPVPGSMRAKDGSMVGWGVAAGAYASAIAPAIATLRATDDGVLEISVGTHELGQGAYSVVAAGVAEVMRVPPSAVTVDIGDTATAPHHLTAGAWGTTTALPAVRLAAEKLLRQLRELDPRAARGRTPAEVLRAAGRPSMSAQARHKAPGAPAAAAFDALRQGLFAAVGPEFKDFVSFAYIAHFAEVHVETTTRRIRVPRVVTVADCGRLINSRTSDSQVRGGVIWGLGAAIREVSEVDTRYGGFLNNDIAEYTIPVHADIPDIHVDFIDKPDYVLTDTGAKTLGELVMTGVAPAITNAIYHATGRRFRRLPVLIDDLFA